MNEAPPGIDMNLIREAIQSRAQGMGVPVTSQMTTPQGTLPTGGANTLIPTPAPIEAAPNDLPVNIPPRQQTGGMIKTAQTMQGPKFNDPQLALISKTMIKKLLEYM